MGSNIEKKPLPIYKTILKINKEIKSVNFFYHKVGWVITLLEAINSTPKIISSFGGTNNIFVECNKPVGGRGVDEGGGIHMKIWLAF